MWGASGVDPGGTQDEGVLSTTSSNQELIDLKDQFEQQQVLIAQLKEMLRKSDQTTVTQEKVEEYANTLTRMNARAKKGKSKKKDGDSDSGNVKSDSMIIDTPAKERIMLLRQQVEENKQKLAERGKFQRGIEETVTQLAAQLDDSQHLISQTPLNLSLADPKIENYSINSAPEELYNLLLSKDKRVLELMGKLQKLEANVLDLQENVKEKDSVIDARTKAITLMSESLSKKGKNTLDALDDTKEQMRKMQENFISLEIDFKNEKQQLITDLEEKTMEIQQLKEFNTELEERCCEQQSEITLLKSSDSENSTVRDLNNQIAQLKNRILELEGVSSDIASRESPQRSSKKGKKNPKQKVKKEEDSEKLEIQKSLNEIKVECEKYKNQLTESELTINELTLKIEELRTKPVVVSEAVADTEEIGKLKKQLDDSNKNMIKIKAQNKSKIKELNKKIEELKKASDSNEEVLRLSAENLKLSERIDILEEQNANFGLDATYTSNKDFGAAERVKELEIKLMEQSELLDIRNESITNLEDQIKSYQNQIESLSERFEKLSHLENAQVASEITSIQFEEQLDKLEMEKRELILEKEGVIVEKDLLLEKIDALTRDKQELSNKLDSYMQENMELIDKLEKLSAEKVSSAESIEIVEGLTQQEKMELEEYQKNLEMSSGNIKTSHEHLDQNPELNESVNQLTEETSDLLMKIELFTEERREVMEKMEFLTTENNQLLMKIHEIENNRDILAETYERLQNEKEELENQLAQHRENIKDLQKAVEDLNAQNDVLRQEVKHGSEVEETIKLETVVPLKSSDRSQNSKLKAEIEEYQKLIEIQKQEINDLKIELLSQKNQLDINVDLQEQIISVQTQFDLLLSENETLKKTLKETGELIYEKDALQTELNVAKRRLDEFNEKLTDNLAEIENYKLIIDENKNEFISSANLINVLQTKLVEKESEIAHSKNEISELNSIVSELTSAVSLLENENQQNNDNNQTLEIMSTQLQELKVLLNENVNKIDDYETELQENLNTISKLNTELKELNNRMIATEHDMECKNDEIKKLTKEQDNKETMIASLQQELKEKDSKFHQTCESLREKCLILQRQIEQNTGALDNIIDPLPKIEALETKNKEQLEKMKKIAANLKKRTITCQELEKKLQETNENYRGEKQAKTQLEEALQQSINELQQKTESLNQIENELALLQNSILEKTKEVEILTGEVTQLKQENQEWKNQRQNYEVQINAFATEAEMRRSDESNNLNVAINEKNEIISNLNRELEDAKYSLETNSNALHSKIQQLEMFIETQEGDLTKYKEKVNKLEEGLWVVQERRLSLERKTLELDAELKEKSSSFEEISQTEDLLEQRLAALIVHDEKIEKHLRDTVRDNQELSERNRVLLEEIAEIKIKLSAATEKNLGASANEDKLYEIQNENLKLNNVIGNLENDNKRLHVDYEKKLNQKKNEIDALELELQGQLEQMDSERKTLLMHCEQLEDKLKEYYENEEILKDDLESCKAKLDKQHEAHQKFVDENLLVMEQLKVQLTSQLNNTEMIEVLKQTLEQKDAEIENLRAFNLEIQRNLGENQGFDVFSPLSSEQADNTKTSQLESGVQPISTFVWPSESHNDPFDFVIGPNPPSEPPQNIPMTSNQPSLASNVLSQNTQEELLKKIRALELLLFNTEQEKEDIVHQCQGLTNEIARLIYEKQSQPPLDILTTQISGENQTHAPQQQDLSSQRDSLLLEQILPFSEAVTSQQDLQALRDFEFSTVKSCEASTSAHEVTEDVIEAKTTYLCYQPDSLEAINQGSVDIFDENDDGWGCGSEEVKLEEDFHKKKEQEVRLNVTIEELDERVRILEVERARHLEEIKQAQIKSGKLLKKLKEFKALNEKLTNELRRSDFGDLDSAIQDELQSQVATLEKKVKESSLELEREKNDKSNLLKKIETLQTVHDRMSILKEKQDIEIISWQRQNRELSAKLEQLEWGDESLESPKRTAIEQEIKVANANSENYETKMKQLTDMIQELTLDNEELQCMLEEQRALRLNAEKAKIVDPNPENVKTEGEYLIIVEEKNMLNEQLLLSVEEKKQLQEQINKFIESNVEMEGRINELTKEKTALDLKLAEDSNNILELNLKLQNLMVDNENLVEKSEFLNNETEQLQTKIFDLEMKNAQLTNDLQVYDGKIQEMSVESADLLQLKSDLEISNQERDKLIVNFEENNVKLSEYEEKVAVVEETLKQAEIIADKNAELMAKIKIRDDEILELNSKLETSVEERSTLNTSIQQLVEEWSQRVDQRGADVAESWKLHLESRETEFSETKQQFKKEINELEEKCNVLVNENNELRKNVDAEIRNEVDKISALQQQINDRQRYINDLTSIVQENHTKIAECEGTITRLNETILEKDTKLSLLELEKEKSSELIEELKIQLNEVVGLQQEFSGYQQTIINLENMMKEQNSNVVEYSERLKLLSSENDELKHQVELLRSKLDDIHVRKDADLNNIEQMQQEISKLQLLLQEKQTQVEGVNEQFREELGMKQIENDELHKEIEKLMMEKDKIIFEMEESRELNEIKINQLQLEIKHVKSIINEKEREYAYHLATSAQESEGVFHEKAQELDMIKRRQGEIESHYEELLLAKDSDMENLRLQLQEQFDKNQEIMKEFQLGEGTLNEYKTLLDLKDQQFEEIQSKIYEQDTLHDEENKQLVDLRHIIEDQVLKIEALKEELYEKSKDYDSLIAELDIRKPTRSEPTTPLPLQQTILPVREGSQDTSLRDENLDATSRVEMDLALYMLHQRDVRCEELTLELMQLLEERDTLQLKLSNAIREKEELRAKLYPLATTPECTNESASAADATTTTPLSSMTPRSTTVNTTGTDVETTEDVENIEGYHLANKLSELKSVGYKRDKTLLDEQSQRRLQQLAFMQQHRDVAALLPPEAAEKLVQDANYTLSRDVQSPPRVLLNWLWGRSTPKVNDI